MSEKIEPALTPEQWASLQGNEFARYDMAKRFATGTEGTTVGLIALLNAALPDSDPRKITRAHVDFLRSCAIDADASDNRGWDAEPLREIANLLEAYLPPA